jgi:cytochrome c-type biogenesis protein
MDTATLSLALTAGALAALNPCGFALLPAYLSMFVVPADPGRVLRALRATGAMTAGFVVVFGVFGLVISPIAAASQQYLPYVTAATGVGLVVLGVVFVAGGKITVPMPRFTGFDGRGAVAAFGYGIVYALASLTCTIAPFLAIVVTSLRSEDTGEGLVLFLTYALGMGLIVGIAAVGVALASGALVGRLRSTGRWMPRVVGALVLLVGAYVAYYGVWEIRVLDGADADDPVIDAALGIQRQLNDLIKTVLP